VLAAVIVLGIALGAGLSGAPFAIVLGTVGALIAIGAAIYGPALGLAVLALTYPFDLTTYAGPLKLTTSEALLVILTTVLVGRLLFQRGAAVRRTPLDLAVLIFAWATLLSLFGLAGHYSDQLLALVKAAGGFLLFFIVTQSLREQRDVWLAIGAALAAGIVVTAATVVPIVTESQAVSDQTRAIGDVIDPNLYAGYLVLLIPLALAAGLAIRRRVAPFATVVLMLLFLGALLATLSRGGWLGAAIGFAVMVAFLPGRRRLILAIVGGALALLLIAGLAGPVGSRLGNSSGPSPAATLESRLPIWSFALSVVVQHPIFGIGVNNFGNYVDAFRPDLDVNQAHDLFLNVLVERGIIGLAALVTFLFLLFRTLRRIASQSLSTGLARGPDSTRILAVGIIASFAAFLGDSLFDVAYYDYKILLLFWLLAGIAASLPAIKQSAAAPT